MDLRSGGSHNPPQATSLSTGFSTITAFAFSTQNSDASLSYKDCPSPIYNQRTVWCWGSFIQNGKKLFLFLLVLLGLGLGLGFVRLNFRSLCAAPARGGRKSASFAFFLLCLFAALLARLLWLLALLLSGVCL